MDSIPTIQFYPTLQCNARCGFCFNKGLPAVDDVRIDDFATMASRLGQAGIRFLDILGGEPTLHPGLIPLLDLIRAQRIKSHLSSNGTNVPLLNVLSRRYDREFLKIGISLPAQGVSAALHAYIMEHRPAVKSVATRQIAIPEHGEQYLRMPGIEYFLLYMDAVSAEDLDSALPFHRFHAALMNLKKMHEQINGVFCSGFLPHGPDSRLLKSVRCPAGTTKLSLSPDGSVYPCYLFFRHSEFRIGNVLQDAFAQILAHPLLQYFRTFHRNRCPEADCPLHAECHGGCPALSYLFYGDCDAPDPRCRRAAARVRAARRVGE